MENKLTAKYGLFTAITMVVGTVIGSGIFFKTEAVIATAQGNVSIGIVSLIIIALIMLICAYTFSIMATRYEKVNGLVDYAEVLVGKAYAYYIGWFMSLIYYPTLTSVLAWVSAQYTCVLFGIPDPATSGGCLVIAAFYLIFIFACNTLSPIIAGKIQVSTTIIKLIPLLLMAVAGMIVGLSNGTLTENFSSAAQHGGIVGGANGALLLSGCVAMAFSYEGWIITTSINSELKNSKRNLPIALVVGTIIIAAVYVLYYIGINGSITTEELLEFGSAQAFVNMFGTVGGTILTVFVVISCLGTCNGLMVACVRGTYSLAARGRGFRPEIFAQVDKVTGMPTNSCVLGLLIAAAWLLYFFGGPLCGWFGPFKFDSSELPIITLYAGYIPIFIMMIKKETTLPGFKRFVAPLLSITCCLFMVFAAIVAHTEDILYYFIVFAAVMLLSLAFRKERPILEQ